MTAQDELRRAIQMMRNGQVEAAASQLNRLANSSAPDVKERAAAYVWLAESRADELDDALAQEFGGWMYGRGDF